jgi:hypothetical protein
LVQLGQALIEAPDAGVIEVSRLMEPHYDGTGMVLLHHSRRMFCCTDRAISAGEQRNNRSANDHWGSRSPTGESTQGVPRSRMADIGLDDLRHLATSFAGTAHREAPAVLPRWPTSGTMYNTSDVVLKKSNTKPEIYSDFRQKPDAESRCVFPKGSLDPLRVLLSYPIVGASDIW